LFVEPLIPNCTDKFNVDPYPCDFLFYSTGTVFSVYSHRIRFFLRTHINKKFLREIYEAYVIFENELKNRVPYFNNWRTVPVFKILLRKSRPKFGSEAPPSKIQIRFSIFLHFINLYLVGKRFYYILWIFPIFMTLYLVNFDTVLLF
jgi:hypothetical protein